MAATGRDFADRSALIDFGITLKVYLLSLVSESKRKPARINIQTKADIEKRIADAEARRNQVKEMVTQGKSLDDIKAAVGDNDKLNYKGWTQVCYEDLTKK